MNLSSGHFSKKTTLFIFLSSLFLTTAVVAEIIGIKIFSVEAMLGMAPAQISLLGFKMDINLSAGVVIWPIVFVLSDIINEYFGRKGVRKITYMGAGFIAYAFLIIFVVTILPPAPFWVQVNSTDIAGNAFNINTAFSTIFRQGLAMIVASLSAFIIGQLLDAYVFYVLKKKWSSSKSIWIRATGSTLISQLIDSFVVLMLAFFVFGNWTFAQVISVGIVQYCYKMLVTFMFIPLLYVAHGVINKYLGKEHAEELISDDIKQ